MSSDAEAITLGLVGEVTRSFNSCVHVSLYRVYLSQKCYSLLRDRPESITFVSCRTPRGSHVTNRVNRSVHHIVDFDLGIFASYAEKRLFSSGLLGPAT